MDEKLHLGWCEWVGLPDFGVPALKAKVDTGARTSSLHALDPEPFTDRGMPWVRFKLMPVQGSSIGENWVKAPLVDRRHVTDSGGHKQERFVVGTLLALGTSIFRIELTLANRNDMRFRMLLGRQALENCVIEPALSHLLPKTDEQRMYLRELRATLKGFPIG